MMYENSIFLFLFLFVFFCTAIAGVVLGLMLRKSRREHAQAQTNLQKTETDLRGIQDVANRYRGVIDVEGAIRVLEGQHRELKEQIAAETNTFQATRDGYKQELNRLRTIIGRLDEQAQMLEFGHYEPQFDYDTSEKYKAHLTSIRDGQKQILKNGTAALCAIEWQVEGSKTKGKQMTKKNLQLMLNAFNGACDAIIAKVTYSNFDASKSKIQRMFERINKLGETNKCYITPAYCDLKFLELTLAHEHQEKKQREKEEQKALREEITEQKRVEKELERAQRTAEAEEDRYAAALKKAEAEVALLTGAERAKTLAKMEALEQKLAAANQNTRALSMAQQTKRGVVYVISNLGSFGDNVYKIGMTRRLDPMDRVKELGDASVPFTFDVHAMIRSDNAPALENSLHKRFHHRRLNKINTRKEFFRVSLAEVEQAVQAEGASVEFTQVARAEDFRKTRALERQQVQTRAQASSVGASAPMPV